MSSTLPNFLRSMIKNYPLANNGSKYSEWYLKLCIELEIEDPLHILEDSDSVVVDSAKPTDKKEEAQRK